MKAALNNPSSWDDGITLAVAYREAVTVRNALSYVADRIGDSPLGKAAALIQPALDELLGFTPENSPTATTLDVVASVARAQYVAAVCAGDTGAADAAASLLFTAHYGYAPQDSRTPGTDWARFTEVLVGQVSAELREAIGDSADDRTGRR